MQIDTSRQARVRVSWGEGYGEDGEGREEGHKKGERGRGGKGNCLDENGSYSILYYCTTRYTVVNSSSSFRNENLMSLNAWQNTVQLLSQLPGGTN